MRNLKRVNLNSKRRTGEIVFCGFCGELFYRAGGSSGQRFCSKECGNTTKRRRPQEIRACQQCGESFKYTEKPASNNAGKFCSLDCRNASYLGTYRGKPAAMTSRFHRPGWTSIAKRFRKANNNFCSCCGKREGRLPVHHVDPYWRSKNNAKSNLVTLCPRCHGALEKLSDRFAGYSATERLHAAAMIQAALADYWHIHQGRRLLAQEASCR